MSKFRVGDRVRVTRDNADYFSGVAGDTGTICRIEYSEYHIRFDTPSHVRAFINNFDEGGYPWLIEKTIKPISPLTFTLPPGFLKDSGW